MNKATILAVDDEKDMLTALKNILKNSFTLLTASTGPEALKKLSDHNVDLVLLDLRLPKMDGLEILNKVKKLSADTEVVMVSASKDLASAVEAMKLGAFDYISKPFEVKELLAVIGKALEKRSLVRENIYLKDALAQASRYCDLLGNSPLMKQVFETIATVAGSDSRILITGESGTGKELVARAIHKKSRRSDKPIIAVNCAALPDNLLESELFGYERGAFTGALERKLGKFELADGGTIFLDEIGCMSPAMQAKLLRVIQDNVIDRVGGAAPVKIDVRLIAATNLDFKKAIAAKIFREDLFYRLNVIPIHLPPLRERKEDIPLFLEYFLMKYRKELNRPVENFTPEAVALLKTYNWPGNVRELQNIIERLVTLSRGKTISQSEVEKSLNFHGLGSLMEAGGYVAARSDFEREYLQKILEEMKGNRSQAAKRLGIARSTFLSKLKSLGLN